MKKFFSLLAMLLMLFSFSSCSHDKENEGEDTITEHNFESCFAYVKNISDPTGIFISNLGYQIRINSTKLKADIVMTGLTKPDGTYYPTMTIKNVPVKARGTWIDIEGSKLVPLIPGFAGVPLIDKLKISICPRLIGTYYVPGFCIDMTVDNTFTVLSTYENQLLFGKTKSKNTVSGDVFETSATDYVINIDTKTGNMNIVMEKAQFIGKMPSMDISVSNIPFTVDGDEFKATIAEVIPTIEGTPYPTFKLTNVKIEFDPAEGFEMEFDCNPPMFEGAFHVTADCDFEFIGSSN